MRNLKAGKSLDSGSTLEIRVSGPPPPVDSSPSFFSPSSLSPRSSLSSFGVCSSFSVSCFSFPPASSPPSVVTTTSRPSFSSMLESWWALFRTFTVVAEELTGKIEDEGSSYWEERDGVVLLRRSTRFGVG